MTTPEEKAAWMVRWTLQGEPTSLPLKELLTAPEEAFMRLRAIDRGVSRDKERIFYLVAFPPFGAVPPESFAGLNLHITTEPAELEKSCYYVAQWETETAHFTQLTDAQQWLRGQRP